MRDSLSMLTAALALILIASVPTIIAANSVATSAKTPATSNLKKVISKRITMTDLEKFQADEITVEVQEDGRPVRYTGIPLRRIIADMMPSLAMSTMADWKNIARKKLVVEVLGEDGYPGLVTVLSIATNMKGDRFIIATKCDGKIHDAAPQMICKTDEAHTRWVHQIVEMRIVAVD